MITEWGRKRIKFILEPVSDIFIKLHITPNTITVLGLLLSVGVGYLIIIDQLVWAGLLYILAAGMDAVDGTLARKLNIRSQFGAFLDSTLDRLGESIILASIGVWAVVQDNENLVLVVLLAFSALVTSYLVSYTRARAEGLGYDVKVGIGTRVERFIIMALALLLQRPDIGVAVITVLAGVTVIQRIYAVWKLAKVT